MEPLTSRIPMMVIEGNHEIEPQGQGGAVTFASYLARFAVPSEESGSNTKFYYSFNAGGIHFIMLGAYVDYNRTGNPSATIHLDGTQYQECIIKILELFTLSCIVMSGHFIVHTFSC